jgi:hypothetical protein
MLRQRLSRSVPLLALLVLSLLPGAGLVLPASAAPPEMLHVLQVTPQLCSRLELAWNPAAAGSPASRALVEQARSFTGSRAL